MAQALLEIKQVDVSFPTLGKKPFEILRNINLQIFRNEVVAILGPSGCGKSTLLRVLLGLERPSQGQILYHNQPRTGLTPSSALVFQNFALFPWLTVQQNIGMGLLRSALSDTQREALIRKVIDTVGLEGFEEAYPGELSGGMKQRVGFARALAVEPELLCMDEPFSSLDVLTGETLRNEVVDLFRSHHSSLNTIVLVTHSIQEAVFMATRIVVMSTHPGSIRTIVDNPLPYPREEHHHDFVRLSQKLYDLVTQSVIPEEPTPEALKASLFPKIQSIPTVSLASTVGLLEVLENEGNMELFELIRHIDLPLTPLLLVVKAAELLGWVNTPGQRVEMTPAGKQFLAAGINERKKRLNTKLQEIFVFMMLLQMLRQSPSGEIDEEIVLSQLAIHFPHESPQRMIRSIISWARYAELFKYNATRKVFYDGKPVNTTSSNAPPE